VSINGDAMYAIANVVYGIQMDDELRMALKNQLRKSDEASLGFTTYYSGSADYTPAFVGVELGEFTECHIVYFKDGKIMVSDAAPINLTPDSKCKAVYQKAMEKLDPEVRKIIEKIRKPSVCIVWSSS
jgi:hypothetical protein